MDANATIEKWHNRDNVASFEADHETGSIVIKFFDGNSESYQLKNPDDMRELIDYIIMGTERYYIL